MTVNAIDEARARELTEAIRLRAQNDRININRQFGVLCLVPITTPPQAYDQLRVNRLCTEAATPQPNPNPRLPDVHSEEILLRQWPNLRNALLQNPTLQNSNYDMFLYSFNSPCPACASQIVNAVDINRLSNPNFGNHGAFYISFTQEYINRNKPTERTLPQTMNTFQAFNRRLPPGRNLILMYYCPQGQQRCELKQPRLSAFESGK